MPKKFTQEQADTLDKQFGAIPIGKYINRKTKRKYQCTICNKIYLTTPECIQKQKQIQCQECGNKIRNNKKRYEQKEIDLIEENIGAIPIGEYKGINVKREYRCTICNAIYFTEPHTVCKGKITCTKCSYKRIANKNKLLIKHVKNRIIEKGLIPIFNDCDYVNNKTLLKIRCKCGKEFKTSFNSIDKNNTNTCGNCHLKRNHKYTSQTALRLHSLIEQITHAKWEHNLHIKNCGCIDIANKELKIAIEYDGYYNHKIRTGDRTKKDKEKINKLVKNGWKVLNIKSGGYDIPTKNKLSRAILDLQKGSNKRTIIMKSWKKLEQKYENK